MKALTFLTKRFEQGDGFMDEKKAFHGNHPVSRLKPASQFSSLAKLFGARTISCLQNN